MSERYVNVGLLMLDWANLIGGAQAAYGPGARLNLQSLPYRAVRGLPVTMWRKRVYVMPRRAPALLERFRDDGYEVVESDGSPQSDDLLLRRDLLELGLRFPCVVIGSGDKDMLPEIDALRSAGVHVRVLAFRKPLSGEVERAASDIALLDFGDLVVSRVLRSTG